MSVIFIVLYVDLCPGQSEITQLVGLSVTKDRNSFVIKSQQINRSISKLLVYKIEKIASHMQIRTKQLFVDMSQLQLFYRGSIKAEKSNTSAKGLLGMAIYS